MANIELPKDAEGREIPLDVEVLYDEYGEKFRHRGTRTMFPISQNASR